MELGSAKQIIKRGFIIFGFIVFAVLVVTVSFAFYLFEHKNEKSIQEQVLSYVLDGKIQTEGTLAFNVSDGYLSLQFTDWKAFQTVDDKKTDILNIQKGDVSFPFPGILFGSSDFKVLDIQNAYLDVDESLMPIRLAHLKKQDDKITAEGRIGEAPLSMVMASSDQGELSKFTGKSSLQVTLGSLQMQADVISAFDNLKNIVLKTGTHTLNGSLRIKGPKTFLNLNLPQDRNLKIEVVEHKDKTKVLVSTGLYDVNDSESLSLAIDNITAEYEAIRRRPAEDDKDEDQSLWVRVVIDEIKSGDIDLGMLDLRIKDDAESLSIIPKKVVLARSEIKGSIILSHQQGLNSRVIINWPNFDYGLLMQLSNPDAITEGRGKLAIDLKADAGDIEAFKKTMDGTVTLSSEKAKIGARFINLWGGGILTAFIPSFEKAPDSDLNCARLKVTYEDGKGIVQPFLLDTDRVTLFGKGEMIVPENSLNLVIKPKSKGMSLGNISSDLRVKGKITEPEFSLDRISALKKIGTIALGAVNPAFYIFSLADLGLNENDVCAQ